MSKARLVITDVVLEGRTQAEVTRDYGFSKGWVSRLVARYRLDFEPGDKVISKAVTRSTPISSA